MLRLVEKTLGLFTTSAWGKTPQSTAHVHDAHGWRSS